jgi:N-methylhydantoinase A
MATRIGIDVGGTFTDLIFYNDETSETLLAKQPTTPAAPEQSVMAAVEDALAPQLIDASRYFLHGTTVGLNALLEGQGASVGLLCTHGFRDVLEVRRGDRDDPYDLFWKPPPPLVARRLRIPIRERMRADGRVEQPLNEDDIREALELFRAQGVSSIAVAFLNAYANPAHELRAAEVLSEEGFAGDISLSHRVSGEYREYERTCTTVIDAAVRPKMASYLARLEGRLRDVGFRGDLLVMRSGGGAMTFREAEARPFETILSGPVAGAEGAAELARTYGLGDVITADVGGTSFDTCLIQDGRPHVLYEGRVLGMPVQTDWVDVRSIGAGGGSIAHVDVGGLLRVGPRSAGADPGPACYGRGGSEPTVTDAALLLGMLGRGVLAGGLRLDHSKAHAVLTSVASSLGGSVEEAAQGVVTIIAASMANAIREITVEQGQDPRQATLLVFGGAGPLFGTLIARELEIKQVRVPPYAGNFSAWGLLGADLTRTVARTRILRLTDDAIDAINDLLTLLFTELEGRSAHHAGDSQSERGVALDMRYVGQEHTLTIHLDADSGRISTQADSIRQLFLSEYRRTFGHEMDEAVEVVAARASLRTPLPRRSRLDMTPAPSPAAAQAEIEAFSFTREQTLTFSCFERDELGVDYWLEGPAIVYEETATTYVDSGFSLRPAAGGSLLLVDEEDGR